MVATLAVVGAALWGAAHTVHGSLWLSRLWLDSSWSGPPLAVPRLLSPIDKDGDGVDDLSDIVAGARTEVSRRTLYRSAYYAGGFPPDGEGTCTDVIWRAFQAAGYDLKAMVDADIQANTADYPRVGGQPDPNIDFRRVPNLAVFLPKVALNLTTDVRPGDLASLSEWQGGDIVVFGLGGVFDHIAVVSDRRRPDGVPLLIHNYGPVTVEDDNLLAWPTGIAAHFRFPRGEESPAGG